MNKLSNNNIAILIVSCDNYSDLWPPFFTAFKRFWPDCPSNVYLLSNFKKFDEPWVNPINVGEDASWSDNLLKALDRLGEEYVFLFIEDLLLIDHVNSDKINELFGWLVKNKPNYVRFRPSPKPDKAYNHELGIVSKGTIYRVSTVLALWKKETLRDLLKTGESAWDFEIYGTERSVAFDGFYSTWVNYFPIINSVIKGKWERNAVKTITRLGIDIDLSKRSVMTVHEQFILLLQQVRHRLLSLAPARYRAGIKKMILGGKYKYRLLNK